MKVSKKKSVISEKTDAGMILFRTKDQTFFKLNSIGSAIWESIDGKSSVESLRSDFIEKNGKKKVPDFDKFLGILKREDLVTFSDKIEYHK